MDEELPFGEWMKRRRAVLDLSRNDLHEKINYAEVTIRKVETGDRKPGGPMVTPLAKGLQIPADLIPAFTQFALHGDYHPDLDSLIGQGRPDRREEGPTNLPEPATSLIGRGHQLQHISKLLTQTEARLVTLTGPGGIGKTRLALAVGQQVRGVFPDGVWWVDLAPIRDPDLVATTIAHALDIREEGRVDVETKIIDFLKHKHVLLLLDNFEQLLPSKANDDEETDPARRVIKNIRLACKYVKFLVTSRELLHLTGEKQVSISTLDLPDPKNPISIDYLQQFDAIKLFIARAQDIDDSFRLTNKNALLVAEICARLDGLPLAIELAAAHSGTTPLAMMLGQLADGGLDFLRHGPVDLPSRQRRMSNAIAWSYGLLDDHEKALFRRLGVFMGGCTLDAAQAVLGVMGAPGSNGQPRHANGNGHPPSPSSLSSHPASLPSPSPPPPPLVLPYPLKKGLDSLVQKSLLRTIQVPDAERRYTMLETIREYAMARLDENGERTVFQHRHTYYFYRLAERETEKATGPEFAQSIQRLDLDLPNLRQALKWLEYNHPEPETGLDLAGRLFWFWHIRGYLKEGRDHIERMLAKSNRQATPILATALHNAGGIAHYQGDYEAAIRFYKQALVVRRLLGDQIGEAQLINNLGLLEREQGNYPAARQLLEECLALAQAIGLKETCGAAYNNLGHVAWRQGRIDQALTLYQAGIAIEEELQDEWGLAYSYLDLGRIHLSQEDAAGALEYFKDSLTRFARLDEQKGLAANLEGLAALALSQGQPKRAARLLGVAARIRTQIDAPLSPPDQADYDQVLANLRAKISRAVFDSEWEAGRRLDQKKAIDYGLQV